MLHKLGVQTNEIPDAYHGTEQNYSGTISPSLPLYNRIRVLSPDNIVPRDSFTIHSMALNLRFAGYQISKPGVHTIELYLDFVCPWSRILVEKLAKFDYFHPG